MNFIKGGVPQEVNIAGFDFDPGEGESLKYSLSGRGGTTHISGRQKIYGKSNPQIGGFELGYVIDDDDMVTVREIQSSGQKLTGYFTTAAGVTFNFFGHINSEEALSNEDGIMTVPFAGIVEPQ